MRDYNQEYQDNEHRQYAYNFDYLVHSCMIREFKKYFQSKNAMEMGCYQGEFTRKLAPLFDELTVLEASSDLIETAKKKTNSDKVKYVNTLFEKWNSNEKFKNIFLIHTLEHLDDPIAVLRKASEWLDDDGTFFIAVPNANALSRQIAVQMGIIDFNTAVTEGEKQHGHNITYSMDMLINHVKSSGLKVIDFGGVFLKPFSGQQFDQLIEHKIVNDAYLEACYQLGKLYPFLAASIYVVCQK